MKKRSAPRIIKAIEDMKVPYNSPVNVLDLYDAIADHCKEQHKNAAMFEWMLIDTMLFADGDLVTVL